MIFFFGQNIFFVQKCDKQKLSEKMIFAQKNNYLTEKIIFAQKKFVAEFWPPIK